MATVAAFRKAVYGDESPKATDEGRDKAARGKESSSVDGTPLMSTSEFIVKARSDNVAEFESEVNVPEDPEMILSDNTAMSIVDTDEERSAYHDQRLSGGSSGFGE